MTERATVHQAVQIGVQTGTSAVAATRRLGATSIELALKAEIQTFRPGGSKYATTTAKGKEWSEGKITGLPDYNELAYLLGASFGNADVVTTDGISTWDFGSHSHAPDTVVRLTVEAGSPVRAHRAASVVVPDLTLKFSRPGGTQEVSGTVRGQALTDDVVMSSSAEALELAPITAEHVTCYLDATAGSIGTTPLNRLFSVEVAHTGRFTPVWALKSSEQSYVADVESAPELSVKITLEADAQGMSLLATLRAGATRYFRLRAADAEGRSLSIDLPVRVTGVSDFSDQDGVFAIEFTLTAIVDPVTGVANSIVLVNDLPAL
jgi:hypothetical protein